MIAKGLRALVTEVDDGDLPAARVEFAKQAPIIDAIMGGGQGAVMAKESMKLLGVIPSAAVRLPLVGASEAEIDMLRRALEADGYL